MFPKSYLFSKSYCERPETAKRLAEIAQRLTGKAITVRFTSEQNSAPASAARPTPETKAAPDRRTLNLVGNDPFVQIALNVFGGEVVDVRTVDVSAASEEG